MEVHEMNGAMPHLLALSYGNFRRPQPCGPQLPKPQAFKRGPSPHLLVSKLGLKAKRIDISSATAGMAGAATVFAISESAHPSNCAQLYPQLNELLRYVPN